MLIRDKQLRQRVRVVCKDCINRDCYWPRKDPGVFTPGTGYRHRSDDYLCGTHDIRGCPQAYDDPKAEGADEPARTGEEE